MFLITECANGAFMFLLKEVRGSIATSTLKRFSFAFTMNTQLSYYLSSILIHQTDVELCVTVFYVSRGFNPSQVYLFSTMKLIPARQQNLLLLLALSQLFEFLICSIKGSWVPETWVLNPMYEFYLNQRHAKTTKKTLKFIKIH